MRAVALCAALAVSVTGTAARADCLKANTPGQVAEGRLSSIVVSIPAYALKEQAYILTPAKPVCLDGEDDYDKVDNSERIHVFSTDGRLRKRLRRLVGKIVQVHGSPFGEMTAHHHAPIVMQIEAIQPLPRK